MKDDLPADFSLPRFSFRPVRLAAVFSPEGPEEKDKESFFEFWIAAQNYITDLRKRNLAKEKRSFRKFETAMDHILPIVSKAIGGNFDTTEAANKIKEIAPDESLRREIFDTFGKMLNRTPEEVASEKTRQAEREADIRRRETIIKAEESIGKGLTILSDGAESGDAQAAKGLVDMIVFGMLLLSKVSAVSPEIISPIAKGMAEWPILANESSIREGIENLKKLDLGSDLQIVHCKFRNLRGTDEKYPTRKWAKAAVRVIEVTKWRGLLFTGLIRELGSTERFADFSVESRWELKPLTEWGKAAWKLNGFSKSALPEWKNVTRMLIRDSVPEFHTYSEWSNQRNNAKASGRDSIGEIQNAILDDIMSALESLAPEG